MAFFGVPVGAQMVQNGPVLPTLKTWASWIIMWCLEPNLVPYKTSRGAKSALKGSSRPPLTTVDPPLTLQIPKNHFSDPPYN